jgi:hypothetical protein
VIITDADWQKEWDYLYQERLGMMVGDEDPSPDLEASCAKEATAIIAELKWVHGYGLP